MKVNWRNRPRADECPSSTKKYMTLLDAVLPLMEQFRKNLDDLEELLAGLPEEFCKTPYGPGKWSIKDTVQHLSDDERIYVYRALRFARGDETALPGFDQDLFASHANANERSMTELMGEFRSVREATITFFQRLEESDADRRGRADGSGFTVRGLAFHIAGHERHHVEILREFIGNAAGMIGC